ncbi:MAG: PEGA domain-containing protein [Deltaproteobacteria bacterium]|nr:PEGA domain-containing protein [Deltaproteobacteria bacterium]
MKSRVVFVVLVAICALGLSARGVHAQQADALKKAQNAFDSAQADFVAGKYDEAAKGFDEAYAARQFPQFLYNAGACHHMKGKKASDPAAYELAVGYYKKYLAADPQAADKAKVEKAIGVLDAEIKRLKDAAAAGAGSGSGSGSGAPVAAPTAPSQEVQALGDAKVRGLVVIESEPQNATIYLDDRKKGAFAQTPWSGSLDGEHKIIVEKRGYMQLEKSLSADPNKLTILSVVMGKEDFMGWVDIKSNIPKSEVYIDDQAIGSVGKTPYSQYVKPGKHTFWVTIEGYDTYKQEIEVLPGGTHEVTATLKGSPTGKLNVLGFGIEDSTIYVDGKLACERGPCLKSLPEGEHTLTVTRPNMKPYSRRVRIQAKTETNVKVTLAPRPSRSDAVIAYILAGAFTGGGIFLGLQSQKYRDDLRKEIDTGQPAPPDSRDPRYTKGKAFAIAADATFAIAGITALTAIYYTFRDKGAPSTGLIDVRAIALTPQIGSGYAGVGMEVNW